MALELFAGGPQDDAVFGKTIAVIFARAGSTRLPNKHLRIVNGSLFIEHVIKAAKNQCSSVYISTNCPDIKRIGRYHNVQIIDRPDSLCTTESLIKDSVVHTIEYLLAHKIPFDYLVQLEGCNLYLKPNLFKEAVAFTNEKKAESVYSVIPCHFYHPKWALPFIDNYVEIPKLESSNTQSLSSMVHIDGTIITYSKEGAIKTLTNSQKTIGFLIQKEDVLHVDDEFDLTLAKFFLSERNKE